MFFWPVDTILNFEFGAGVGYAVGKGGGSWGSFVAGLFEDE